MPNESTPPASLFRVEVAVRDDLTDARGAAALAELVAAGLHPPARVRAVRGYAIALANDAATDAAQRIASSILADPVADTFTLLAGKEAASIPSSTHRVDVCKRPGVMDPSADGLLRAIRATGERVVAVRTYHAFLVTTDATPADLLQAARKSLGNDVIEEISIDTPGTPSPLSTTTDAPFERIEVLLPDEDNALLDVSIRGGLSLSLVEMRAIREHYREMGRSPSDVELETVAQTWSEHCKHKTLAGRVDLGERSYENLLKQTIFDATTKLDLPWCISVFEDNAGVVAFDDDFHVTFKVETHNHPSAIEPYGGAGTGIGGVLRDTLGTGLGARPLVSTDVFCFGPPDLPRDAVPPGALHPLRVLKGVVAGVRDYGNRMGIPTANGALVFDSRYTGNPLVFCGSVGILPVDKVKKAARPGDLIVVAGGRTGRDGIHGATFSSRELHSESEAIDSGAVQIGNPITEKGVMDAMLQARDRDLYTCVTDCGAGGLSSAVGEMAEKIGAIVDLDQVPLKYAGLTYAEIWISEAQERMVFSVPPKKRDDLLALFASEDVEATVIGEFTADKRLVLRHHGTIVGDMELEFLFDGLPKVVRKGTIAQNPPPEPKLNPPSEYAPILLRLLSEPNIASKAWVVRQYDHEVQAGSVVKPYCGPHQRTPSDAAVVRPRLDSFRGIAVGNGIAPSYGDIDAYQMGLAAIDEAMRNVIAVGGRADRVALLDNFCAGNCERPEILGQVARVAEACRDAALALGTPFISGKDSLNNEFRTDDGTHAIPTTLLVSSMAHVDDVRRACTSDLKQAGNHLLLVGSTRAELGGSAYYGLHGEIGRSVPRVDLDVAKRTFAAMSQLIGDGRIRACHDLADGGLAVAVAEMAFAGHLGAEIALKEVPRDDDRGDDAPSVERDDVLLFSESTTRFLIEVEEAELTTVTSALAAIPHAKIGVVTSTAHLTIRGLDGTNIVDSAIEPLRHAFEEPLDFGSPAHSGADQ